MIYLIQNHGDETVHAVMQHAKTDFNLEEIETRWYNKLYKKNPHIRIEERIDLFIKFLVEKHHFEVLDFKEAQVI